jgi:hypothetical protein
MRPRKLHVSDKQLFTLNLFAAFVNNDYIKTDKIDWYYFWQNGIDRAEMIGIHHSMIAPILLMSIINAIEFDFTSWYLKNYYTISGWTRLFFKDPNIPKDGIKLTTFFNDIELNEIERQNFNKYIIIEQVEDTIIILLNSELLKNEGMVKCFIENFIIISMFSESKLFIIYFREKH